MAENNRKSLQLCIVTPTNMLFDEEVDMVIMRTQEGDLGVLAGHEPLTTSLGYGVMKAVRGEQEILFSVLGGFVEVGPQKVTVLSDAAERPEQIDVNRAQSAKERAERMLRSQSDDVDTKRASLALRRALVRIEASSYPLIGGRTNTNK